MLLCAAARALAGTLEITVTDERGQSLENVVVYATAMHGPEATGVIAAAAAPAPAVMDQQNLEFVPHILVVQSGSEVAFPNTDNVSHHVYSFSAAKSFELPLYKGDVYPPVLFDRPGIVVVGCNIHDGMLGYVVVVDTPHHAVTDVRGRVSLVVPNGEYAVNVWTPRARPSSLPAEQRVVVTDTGAAVAVRVAGRLAPPHGRGSSSLTWERY